MLATTTHDVEQTSTQSTAVRKKKLKEKGITAHESEERPAIEKQESRTSRMGGRVWERGSFEGGGNDMATQAAHSTITRRQERWARWSSGGRGVE